MINVTIDTPISRDDVRDLKAADSVVYRYRDGESYIQVNGKNGKVTNITCNTVMSNYSKSLGDIRVADYGESDTTFNRAFRTMINCMREGDILSLRWIACNNNQYLDRAGLYQDQLYLGIERDKFKQKCKKFVFHVATEVCENNTAKMIRHTSTPLSILER